MAACTTNPFTGEQLARRAATYGAIGGVVCGLIGSRDSSQHARKAALRCGAIHAASENQEWCQDQACSAGRS